MGVTPAQTASYHLLAFGSGGALYHVVWFHLPIPQGSLGTIARASPSGNGGSLVLSPSPKWSIADSKACWFTATARASMPLVSTCPCGGLGGGQSGQSPAESGSTYRTVVVLSLPSLHNAAFTSAHFAHAPRAPCGHSGSKNPTLSSSSLCWIPYRQQA